MKPLVNNFEDNLCNIFSPVKLHRRDSLYSAKSTTEDIIDNINNFDESFNNPKTIKRMEDGYKYLKNLVNSIKSPTKINHSSISLNNILKSLSTKSVEQSKQKEIRRSKLFI
jgi:hypothetical protein